VSVYKVSILLITGWFLLGRGIFPNKTYEAAGWWLSFSVNKFSDDKQFRWITAKAGKVSEPIAIDYQPFG